MGIYQFMKENKKYPGPEDIEYCKNISEIIAETYGFELECKIEDLVFE